MIDSTSDARTANNAARHQYRVLNDAEKAKMQEIKDIGAALIAKINELHANARDRRINVYDLTLARTHAEDAVMRAVRFITA